MTLRGHVHSLRLIGTRLQSGPNVGEPSRDAEGRWIKSPNRPPLDVAVTELRGRIGYPNRDEVPEGEDIDNAAHLPRGTTVRRGDELEAYDIPDPDADLNGRYEIVGVQPGPALVRVLLRRFTT